MLYRCETPSSRDYHLYGKKGIKVCDRWHNFEEFLRDMGECPDSLELDRIDYKGNYEPGNCRWATEQTQSENRSYTRWVVLDGKKMTMKAAAKQLGLNYDKLRKFTYKKGKHNIPAQEAIARLSAGINP